MKAETSIYDFAKQGLSISPNKTAIWFYGKAFTYLELFYKIDNVADHLYTLGVSYGTVVTIHLPNCPQAVMAIYAVAKLGGICNMVHPLTPMKSLRENMQYTESEILITGNHFPECDQVDFADKLLYVDISAHMGFARKIGYCLTSRGCIPFNAISFEKLERPLSADVWIPVQTDLSECCAVYLNSSGTTGEPKTVMHCHRAINQEVLNAKHGSNLDIVDNEVVLEILPLFHGMGLVIGLHIALSGGAKVVQMSAWDEHLAIRLIRQHQISILIAVPKIFYKLMENNRFSCKHMVRLFCGGESFDPIRKAEFLSKLGNRICEGYGMTELVASCCGENPTDKHVGLTPFPNCRFAVINSLGEISEYGEGELIISSNTIMMGYFKDEPGTQAVLVKWNGKVWIKTGDFGLIDLKGRIHYKERMKNIILHNGYNVYPYEVEQVIMRSELVEEVCVFGIWNDRTKTQNVVGAIVPKKNCIADIESSLMHVCEMSLPQYAIPKIIRIFESLPKNEMGKIDRMKVTIAYEKTR